MMQSFLKVADVLDWASANNIRCRKHLNKYSAGDRETEIVNSYELRLVLNRARWLDLVVNNESFIVNTSIKYIGKFQLTKTKTKQK